MKSQSNLNINLGTINEEGSCKSVEDPDCDLDEVSNISMDDDEHSFDTVTAACRSEAFKAKHRAAKAAKAGKEVKNAVKLIEKISGNTKLGLPFLLDFWRDCMSHARISVQVQMLSGKDACKKVFVRISADGNELVLTLPMSPHLSRSDFAFNSFVLADRKVSAAEQHFLTVLLKHHPKCTARMVAVSKVKGRSNTDGFCCEQRITLPRKVQHKFASVNDGDDLFVDKKFVEYPDGSVFLHCELIAEAKDDCIPEERMIDPKMMKTPVPAGAAPMDTADPTTARVLPDPTMTTNNITSAQQTKRPRVHVETVDSDDDDDDEDDGDDAMSFATGDASQAAAQAAAKAAAKAEAEANAFAEQARKKGASILELAEQTQTSSLQSAVESGQIVAAGSNLN